MGFQDLEESNPTLLELEVDNVPIKPQGGGVKPKVRPQKSVTFKD